MTNNSISIKSRDTRRLSTNGLDSMVFELSGKSMLSSESYKAKMRDPAFRKRKSRLGEQLTKSLLTAENKNLLKSNYDKQYIRVQKYLAIANILYLNYSKRAANELMQKCNRIGERYHFTDVRIQSLRLLKYHAALHGHKKSFEEYSHQLSAQLELLSSEASIENASQEIILELHHSASLSSEIKGTFIKKRRKIEKLASKYPSRTNLLNSSRFNIHLSEYLQDHKQVLQYCKRTEQYLNANNHLIQKMRLAEFALYKLNSCLRMQDIKAGELSARSCEKIFAPGTDNWYIYLEYYFLLCMHTLRYQPALTTLSQVMRDSRFLKGNASRLEKWRIYEAYLSFASPSKNRRFNLYRFLNEVPLHSSDKSGFNLSILIAQIISLLNLGRYDDILEKSDALNIYCRRYIRIKDKYRTYYFMKMLQVMIKYSFDAKKTEQIAQKFLDAMSSKGKKKRPLEEMEVIPYETLWCLILDRLQSSASQMR